MGGGKRFSKEFSGQHYMFFFAFFSGLLETCSFWYGLKDLYTLHTLADKVVMDR